MRRGRSGQWNAVKIAAVAAVLVLVLLVVLVGPSNLLGASVFSGLFGPRKYCQSGKVDLDQVEVVSWKPRVFRYHKFLSDKECDYIIAHGTKLGLSRSQVLSAKGEDFTDNDRTSYGVFLAKNMTNDYIIRTIEERIAKWTNIPSDHGEHFYLLRYRLGQEYKIHHDAFDPTSVESTLPTWGPAGTRIATVLLYLEAPDHGGETAFPLAGLEVPIVRGDAVLFFTFKPDWTWDELSLHTGKPVLDGEKFCLTKWLRVNPYFHRTPLEDIEPKHL